MNKQVLIRKINAYERLMRLDKPIGILLLMWPTLWALLVAGEGQPNWHVTIIFITGVVLMRSAGCVMNDIADRHFDGHVERTKNRPLVIGEVSTKEALFLAAVLTVAAFILVCFLNTMTILLSIVALFLAATYPLTKRFLVIPQAYLGIAFGVSVPMAFAALLNQIPAIAWWLMLANIFWAVAYDTEYAMVDRNDDIKIGIQSSALLFGRYDVFAIMCSYIGMLGIFIGIGLANHFSGYYYVGIAVATALVIWQYQMIKNRSEINCFKAFLANNWIGFILLLSLFAEYYLK
ncbi:MAG: 4-hydroxybenzoate octaprenyltransferase [Methylotenera sp.]|jgi:4-hydroxybenzoate polyprenyltransferase